MHRLLNVCKAYSRGIVIISHATKTSDFFHWKSLCKQVPNSQQRWHAVGSAGPSDAPACTPAWSLLSAMASMVLDAITRQPQVPVVLGSTAQKPFCRTFASIVLRKAGVTLSAVSE